jgi:hypothetical protein
MLWFGYCLSSPKSHMLEARSSVWCYKTLGVFSIIVFRKKINVVFVTPHLVLIVWDRIK